jgi:hypothetical protein
MWCIVIEVLCWNVPGGTGEKHVEPHAILTVVSRIQGKSNSCCADRSGGKICCGIILYSWISKIKCNLLWKVLFVKHVFCVYLKILVLMCCEINYLSVVMS